MVLHAALLRGVPLWVDGDSSQIGLEFLGHGFSIGRWGKWIGVGFYTAMVGLVSYHVVHGEFSLFLLGSGEGGAEGS